MSQRHRVPSPFLENTDSIGLGKLTENQMKAVVELVKSRGALNQQVAPERTGDRGIVIAAGGRYAPHGYANAKLLRMRGVQHPIQIWHYPREYPEKAAKIFSKLDVELVDAFEIRAKYWHRNLKTWNIKHFAAMRCPWEDVVFYDADCFACCDPEVVWNDPEYQEKGALFFSDIKPCRSSDWGFVLASVRIPDHEMESGIFFWNRVKSWPGIRMCSWMGEHSEVWDKHIFGDKDRPYLAFGTTETAFIQSIERTWENWGILQAWKGRKIAAHAMAAKRQEHPWPDKLIPGLFEEWRMLVQ